MSNESVNSKYGVVHGRSRDAVISFYHRSPEPNFPRLFICFYRPDNLWRANMGNSRNPVRVVCCGFADGFAGEPFALPDALGLLRKTSQTSESEYISIIAADPLNLTGIILPGKRVPAVTKNRLLFRGGKFIAEYVAGEIQWQESLDQ